MMQKGQDAQINSKNSTSNPRTNTSITLIEKERRKWLEQKLSKRS